MSPSEYRQLEVTKRTIQQNAALAITDIYDAIVELVTNADDRYQLLGHPGRIEIDVERRRGAKVAGLLIVRDFADGMTAAVMQRKLARMGGRESGMSEGRAVRGTNSRGAKDVATLGHVSFDSIAEDGQYHHCCITPRFEFGDLQSQSVTATIRRRLGIARGSGTVVSIEIRGHKVPLHDTMREQLGKLVVLREILANEERSVVLRDLQKERRDAIVPPKISGKVRIKRSIVVPGYDAKAKLVIERAAKPFERAHRRFRMGGILVTSRHAVHESTLFDSRLENDPNALWFYGRLRCEAIDDLLNEWDDRYEADLPPTAENPRPVIDPSRKSGLTKDHPFVQALFGEAKKILKPLVEEERKRQENERSKIESEATRKRLSRLEKVATKFLSEYQEDEEPARDPNAARAESRFHERGYALSPPFAQILVDQTQRFWLTVLEEAFPEVSLGDSVQVECLSDEISSSVHYAALEAHPTREKVLRLVWTVRGVKPTSATAIRVRVGPIVAESPIEVLATPAERYADLDELRFARKHYRVNIGAKAKKLRVIAPIALAPEPTLLRVESSNSRFVIGGETTLHPVKDLPIAACEFRIRPPGDEDQTVISAAFSTHHAECKVESVHPAGIQLRIVLEDIDLGNQRHRWRGNLLEIAARHPSLVRYLGPSRAGFPGQEAKHFRLLLAEIVAEAISSRLVEQNALTRPEQYENADWNLYYAEYTRHLTRFLPIAHRLQVPAEE
jgi:hypothetical protein